MVITGDGDPKLTYKKRWVASNNTTTDNEDQGLGLSQGSAGEGIGSYRSGWRENPPGAQLSFSAPVTIGRRSNVEPHFWRHPFLAVSYVVSHAKQIFT